MQLNKALLKPSIVSFAHGGDYFVSGIRQIKHFLFRVDLVVDRKHGLRPARRILAASGALNWDLNVAGVGEWIDIAVRLVDLLGLFGMRFRVLSNIGAAVRDWNPGLVPGWIY